MVNGQDGGASWRVTQKRCISEQSERSGGRSTAEQLEIDGMEGERGFEYFSYSWRGKLSQIHRVSAC